jgi:trans-aconitate methyltransferase
MPSPPTNLYPNEENFTGKYLDTSPVVRRMLDNYFRAVATLLKHADGVATALEIGCGEGFSTHRLRQLLPEATALEASDCLPDQVSEAQTRNPTVGFQTETAYQLQRPDSSQDLVVLLEVLEHLEAPHRALAEIKRVSRRFLLVGVPREPLWRALNMLRGKYLHDFGNTPGHVNHWTTRSIQRFVGRHFGGIIKVVRPIPWTLLLAEKCPRTMPD